jgi:hypothetical protein
MPISPVHSRTLTGVMSVTRIPPTISDMDAKANSVQLRYAQAASGSRGARTVKGNSSAGTLGGDDAVRAVTLPRARRRRAARKSLWRYAICE